MSSQLAPELQEALLNGKANMNGTVGKIENRVEKEENIFLFIPNVIGRSRAIVLLTHPAHIRSRVFSDHSCHCLAILHAAPSANLLTPLLNILPS
jgi:hypothetical protein